MSSEEERELILNNLPLVKRLAAHFIKRAERDDLIQAGSIGLLKAVRNYDPSLGTALSTYAVPLILGEMRRLIRDDRPVHIPRGQMELASRIARLRSERGEMRLSEIAEELGITPEEAADALNASMPVRSLSEPLGEDGAVLADMIQDPFDTEKSVLNRLFSEELLSRLDERERKLICLRFFRELTQEETGRRLGMTQTWVSRKEREIVKGLGIRDEGLGR